MSREENGPGCCVMIMKLVEAFLNSNNKEEPSQPSIVAVNTEQAPTNQMQTDIPMTQPTAPVSAPKPQQAPVSTSKPPKAQGKQEHHVDDASIIAQADELRAQAKKLAAERGELYEKSQRAWNSNEKDKAKEWSDLAKEKGAQMEKANRDASDLFFKTKNAGRPFSEIDLHGQFVNEAIRITDSKINECKEKNVNELTIIVGKGLHSIDGVAKIKPAIIELLNKHNIDAKVGEPNPGCITIHLDKPKSRAVGDQHDIVNQCPVQ
ncbi:hypothetical protein HDV01_005210 [Terramyces sp. JEL0728]|nr:hypothetical protein HDV01_005210 [Terramyces sp. JEL0728]